SYLKPWDLYSFDSPSHPSGIRGRKKGGESASSCMVLGYRLGLNHDTKSCRVSPLHPESLTSLLSQPATALEAAGVQQRLHHQFLLLPFADMREMHLWHFWLFLGISLSALLGNGIIITTTTCDKHLHTLMYFFLLSLSFLDLGCISTTAPKSIANSLWDTRAISCTCAAQVFFFLLLFSACEDHHASAC
uniref:G-protein coupled receptors family 1 profile domain-containing protein n=1 Tax=Amazona collaria TaxID=241587 RepID=A0A8B9G3R5_9PSIT